MAEIIECRWSREADSAALAALHRDAWANAYAGIIPGVALERMLARRGPRWWARLHRAGDRVLVIELALAGADPVGYAMLGPSRMRLEGTGEIYELYLRPECQGTGLGRRLFEAARARLREAGRPRTVVWALAANTLACRFYRGLGGTEFGRTHDYVGGRRLEKIGFRWS